MDPRDEQTDAKPPKSDRSDVLEQIYRVHYDPLLHFAYLLTAGRDAEDLVQDTIVRALRHWDRSAPVEAFGAWSRKTMLRLFLNRLRRARYERRDLSPADEPTDPPAGAAVDVLRALAALPARQRAAVVLRYFEDLPEAEIADRMGCRRGTVKALLHQARSRLRIDLAD
ncbi:MAG: RNA polymerase sigma factor [Actinomycetota bacterium]